MTYFGEDGGIASQKLRRDIPKYLANFAARRQVLHLFEGFWEAGEMGDAEKDFLVDAVAQFLQSSTWLDAVSAFLENNFHLFLDADSSISARADHKLAEYSLAQYESFTAFKDTVERLLETVMADLGCSGEDLVDALGNGVRNEQSMSGERKFFVKTLLAFDDYDAFCHRITQYAAEKRANGYTVDSVAATGELTEWKLQEVIARSILDAKAQGLLDESEEVWIPWAEAMVEMASQTTDVLDSSENPVSEAKNDEQESKEEMITTTEALPDDENERMKELQQTLVRERLKVDLLVAQRIADANASLKRQMLHLAELEAVKDDQSPISDEDELDSQLKQVEAVRERLKEVKKQCFEFKDVTQDQMDKIYLFLKEKVHYKQDLVTQEKEISAFVLSSIQEKDTALIPLMLEWLLLESELLRAQKYIQELLNGPQDPGFWTQQWDEASQAVYYVNSVSGESMWEAPQCGYYDLNQEFQWESEETFDQPVSTTDETVTIVDTTEDSQIVDTAPIIEEVSQKLESPEQLGSSEAATTDLLEMASVLDRISREHDEERKRLELVFELEKARQKEELRKRKEKKRREKLAKKKKRDANRGVNEDETPLESEPHTEAAALPPAPLTAEKAEAKTEENLLSIRVPGHGRVDLSHLLSEAHAKRHNERKGIDNPAQLQTAHMMLHPTSLQYLAQQMIRRQGDGSDVPSTARKEIVLEEIADEK